jgi:hypothetical protein
MTPLERAIAERDEISSLHSADYDVDDGGFDADECGFRKEDMVNKILTKAEDYELNSYSFICDDGWTERFLRQACYASLHGDWGDGPEHLPASFFIDYVGERGSADDVQRSYLEYVLYRSPFRRAFKACEDVNVVIDSGIIIDTMASCAQYCVGAAIAVRQTWEYPEITKRWKRLVDNGVQEHLAFYFATIGEDYNHEGFDESIRVPGGGGGNNHTVFASYNPVYREALQRFINDDISSINNWEHPEYEPFGVNSRYCGVGPAWDRETTEGKGTTLIIRGETHERKDSFGYGYRAEGLWPWGNITALVQEFITTNQLEVS